MNVRFVAWNTHEALGHTERQTDALELIRVAMGESVGAVALSEVCREAPVPPSEVADELLQFARKYGYRLLWTPYDDLVPRANHPPSFEQYMAMLVRVDKTAADQDKPDTECLRLGGRNALSSRIMHEGINIDMVSVHHEDRAPAMRGMEAMECVSFLSDSDSVMSIVGGDFNERSHGLRSFVFDIADMATQRIFMGQAPEGVMKPADRRLASMSVYGLRRAKSIVERLAAQGQQEALKIYTSAGFSDTDPHGQPTHFGGNIDHILYRSSAASGCQVAFSRGERASSDHRPIIANFEW